MTIALSVSWLIGYAIGVVVIVIAATLLLAIIGLGRRIVAQADAITAALDGARSGTDALFDVKQTNHALDRITRGLQAARDGGPDGSRPDEGEQPGPVGRLTRGLRRGRGADEA